MYKYYDFRGIAREKAEGEYWRVHPTTRFEFYAGGGKWVKDETRSLHLSDAMMDYGDYSTSDYDDLTEDEAMRRIAEIDKKA